MSGTPGSEAPSQDRFVIPVAKGTLVRFFTTSLIGVVVCVFMLLLTREHPSILDRFIPIIGIVGVVFCALTALYAGKRVFDPTPGLILDEAGIVDRSNAICAGRVRWEEIREIRVTRTARQRFLTVVVNDPESFIRRGNPIRRKVVAANHRMSGSPINITASTLKIPFEELVAKTSEFYQRYGRTR